MWQRLPDLCSNNKLPNIEIVEKKVDIVGGESLLITT